LYINELISVIFVTERDWHSYFVIGRFRFRFSSMTPDFYRGFI